MATFLTELSSDSQDVQPDKRDSFNRHAHLLFPYSVFL